MIPHEIELVNRLADEPFALLGVNSDSDHAKTVARMQRDGVTWRSFMVGDTRAEIPARWNVRGWPTIYVMDHKGIIRFKGVRGEAMSEAVDTLLAEMNAEQGADSEDSPDEDFSSFAARAASEGD